MDLPWWLDKYRHRPLARGRLIDDESQEYRMPGERTGTRTAGRDQINDRMPQDICDNNSEEEEEWVSCPGKVESLRTKTGLEIGCVVEWPGSVRLELQTTLPESSIAPMFDGTQWAGTRIWRASLICLHYLLIEIEQNRLTASRILELGSGLGVPGMVLHSRTGCHAVVSDMADLLEQLNMNIESNFPKDDRIHAAAIDWGDSKSVKALLHERGPFDVVLNCDCIYQPLYGESWKALLECQAAVLMESRDAFVITSVERRRADAIDQYIATAGTLGLSIDKLVIPFEHPPEVELYRLKLKIDSNQY